MTRRQRIRLRAPEIADFESYTRWVNNEDVWQYLAEGPVFESYSISIRNDDENRYIKWMKDSTKRLFSIETLDGKLIGNCMLMDIDWLNRRAELAITVGEPDYWSQGYGTEAVGLLLNLAFNEYNLHRVFLTVVDINPRAQRCYEKVGFRQEGVMREADFVHGDYHDHIVMSVLDYEYRAMVAQNQPASEQVEEGA